MKVALERIHLLKRKMSYHIDKLLALSTLRGGAGRGGGALVCSPLWARRSGQGEGLQLSRSGGPAIKKLCRKKIGGKGENLVWPLLPKILRFLIFV